MSNRISATSIGPVLWLLAALAVGSCRERESSLRSEPVTLSYFRLGWSQPDELPVASRLSQEFTEQTGIRIIHTPVPETTLNQLAVSRKLLAAGSGPDVLGIDVIWSGALESDLIDLRPHLEEEISLMDPQLVGGFTVGSKLVAVPYQIQIGVLEYRTDLLREYGFRHPPRTWDELERMAQKIQAGERAKGSEDFWGYVWQGSADESLTCNALEWQAAEGAGQVIEADALISVNNPATVRAWRRAKKWIGWISPPSVMQYREFDSMNVFDSGRAAFHRTWGGTTRGAVLTDREGLRHIHWRRSLMEEKVGYAGIPGGPGGRFGTLGGSGLAISRRSPHQQEAIELIRFLIRQQVDKRDDFIDQRVTQPELYELPEVLDATKSEHKSRIVSRPSALNGSPYELVTRAYIGAVHDVLTGEKQASDAAADLEKELTKVTGFKTARPQRLIR